MWRRFGQGFELTRCSLRVLRLDKELLLFPIFSCIATVLVMVSFFVPLWKSGYLANMPDSGARPIDYVMAFGFYLCTYSVIFFFNAAIVECAIMRFRGQDPTVKDGLRGAWSRLPQILGWALVAATVGMVLRALQERFGFVGKLIIGLIGLAWTAATFFVVPVIVMERLGPIDAVKRSTAIVKSNWAEAAGANTGVGLMAFCGYLVAMMVVMGGVFVMTGGSAAVGGIIVGAGILAFIIVSLCASVVQAIVVGALYLYAGQGHVPEQFEQATLNRIFTAKAR